MDTARIKLTLGNVEREIEASIFDGAKETYLIVYGIALRTTHGKKTHSGYVWLKSQQEGHIYNARDIVDIGYSGMRGNGHGMPSRFSYIGFSEEEC